MSEYVLEGNGLHVRGADGPVAMFIRPEDAARFVEMNKALKDAGVTNVGAIREATEALEEIGFGDEKPGHVHYLKKSLMAEIARKAHAKLTAKGSGDE
jgi:hypothetical protein